ncbi:hypothetical protein AVEN_195185-1 [Araneus ventricosus]|uniref:Tesmin/TSO1-like CXC domain-containing protein n=1 Tax=Araneus ventricosus TaxID=182803 RepID=A0A4Y2JET9_ARAVE|nr:hypothetical protein AVEN_195185-1 [Araneus ventricosus]
MWLDQVFNPLNWGWQTTKHGLAPITTIKDLASQSLLMAIFCKYAKGCRSTCSCRNSGIKCSANCENCKEYSCSNPPPQIDEQMLLLSEDDKDQMMLKKRKNY